MVVSQSDLAGLGLTSYQARIVAHLENEGDSTALEISEATGIPYTKIYFVLDSLRYKGFVIAELERPMKFKAVLEALVKQQEQILKRLKQKIGG